MNLFEVIFAFLAIGGALAGGIFGHESHGWIGATVGALVGAFGGVVVGIVLVIVLAAVLSAATDQPMFGPKEPPQPHK